MVISSFCGKSEQLRRFVTEDSFVEDNCEPGQVFSADTLAEWARENGFVEA